ncbi:hypothetical protein J6590_017069 [Homalodisca vitripennis]|nr:hypothetical protein J6590_017069 [Homalodisca vitripennis]
MSVQRLNISVQDCTKGDCRSDPETKNICPGLSGDYKFLLRAVQRTIEHVQRLNISAQGCTKEDCRSDPETKIFCSILCKGGLATKN